jgi:hypothetical protein
VSLVLDDLGTCIDGSVGHGDGKVQAAFVIDADFGDDDGRVVVTDESTGDAEFSHFVLQ